MVTLYGISNCDTVKKARRWLDQADVSYQFYDFRVDGLEEGRLREWVDLLGWEGVVNKRSTTWRGLADDVKSGMNETLAVRECLKAATLIKRPVLEVPGGTYTGFKEAQYAEVFKK